jgi:hypothetical protein
MNFFYKQIYFYFFEHPNAVECDFLESNGTLSGKYLRASSDGGSQVTKAANRVTLSSSSQN